VKIEEKSKIFFEKFFETRIFPMHSNLSFTNSKSFTKKPELFIKRNYTEEPKQTANHCLSHYKRHYIDISID